MDAYVRMRCDPEMMAHLGGPIPRDLVVAAVPKDIALVASGTALIKMIVVDTPEPGAVAGSVTLWAHEVDGEPAAEIGWMVLPEQQGRGLARWAVGTLLDEARRDDRWRVVHAFPGIDNGPSNGICRSLGFTLLGPRHTPFRDQLLRTNHWCLTLQP